MTSDEITFDRVVLVIIETKREQVKNYIENTSILNYSKRSNPAASIFIMAVGFPLTMLKAGSWWAEVGCESFIQILIESIYWWSWCPVDHYTGVTLPVRHATAETAL